LGLKQQQDMSDLGDRMKAYEAEYQHYLDKKPTIVRLDGHGFSKFTASFDQPYDERFHTCMMETCKDLMRKFHDCSTAYTQSDEITLVFPTGFQNYNARSDKYLSLLAATTSVRFNHHLGQQPHIDARKLGCAVFDARVFQVPDMNEALNCILWRSRYDCTRNSVDKFARQSFSAKQLFRKNTTEKIAMMAKIGIMYEEKAPLWVQHGTTIKKVLYFVACIDQYTGQKTACMRTNVVDREIHYKDFSASLVEMIGEKYLNETQKQDNLSK
jgi:tRNA(His) guanylyltransferase